MRTYMWICPCCWEEIEEYGAIELVWDQAFFPRQCEHCYSEWEEWYNMDFIWHENVVDKNWNEVNLSNNKKRKWQLEN